MTFAQFLAIVRARRRLALSVLLAVIGITLAVSLVLPRQYLGVASVVVDAKPDPVSALQNMINPSFMATQVDILSSDRVALRVIRDLKLSESPAIREQWMDETGGEGAIEQWLVILLQKQLDIRPSRESNVITISYKAPDRRFAASLANAFAQAYIATTLELRVDPAKQFTTFFDAQTRDAREALTQARAKASAFERQHGILASDERLDTENARLAELTSQLVQVQAILADSASRQAQAQGGKADRMQEVLNNPLIAGLMADLTRNRARLQELNSRLGSNNPQVIESKANIGELEARIDAETRRVSAGVGVSNVIARQRESEVQRSLAAQRSRVQEMKAVRDQGLILQREVENAQRTFDSLSTRYNQIALESQTTQSYANVLTSAQPAVQHTSPNVLLNTALAIFAGTLLAIGVTLLAEMRDPRVRLPHDVVAALNLPVLVSLPKPGAKRFKHGRSVPMLAGGNRVALGHTGGGA